MSYIFVNYKFIYKFDSYRGLPIIKYLVSSYVPNISVSSQYLTNIFSFKLLSLYNNNVYICK